ncbi:MAG: NAD(P)/FAD-dependent oxidoreductase [Alphaproteobacteria bacterium]|nr:NAD(P)/FAD-dependent oxidoreductase [Alphaproteobacteria bacterium]
MRYDACIIGAGADGLAAAAVLAARGRSVMVIERDSRCGGRCATREFHPGFRASPFVDELPAIPDDIFRALDLARRGAIHWQPSAASPEEPYRSLRRAVIARAMAEAQTPPVRRRFRRPTIDPWPGEELARLSLAQIGAQPPLGYVGERERSAVLLLAGPGGGMVAGGLGRLGEALRMAAQEAGAEITCGLEATDIRRFDGRVAGVALADGTEVAARAVISTLDLKRTFLSLFSWNELPAALVERAGAFRAAPGTARLLVALAAPPPLPAGVAPGAVLWSASWEAVEEAYRAWRRGAVPERPVALLRLVSACDPSLAPDGAAVLTVTLGGIPLAPFDGAWTNEKREGLREQALAAVEALLPGARERVVASELLVPPDIEERLGLSAGDLSGGDLAADQMLAFRPFTDCAGTRTPVKGLYLAGPSSALAPLAACAGGVAAARAVLSDLAAGRLR